MKNNDKENIAAALKYDYTKNNSPEIIALGEKNAAKRILQKAKEHDIPIYENEALAQSLTKLSIGQEIPKELYEVVAQVLLYVAELDDKRGKYYGQ